MPDLGIGEGLAALVGGGLFDGLLGALGLGGADAAAAGTGAATSRSLRCRRPSGHR